MALANMKVFNKTVQTMATEKLSRMTASMRSVAATSAGPRSTKPRGWRAFSLAGADASAIIIAAHVIPGAGLDGKHQPLRSLRALLTPSGQDRHQLCMDRDGARLSILG